MTSNNAKASSVVTNKKTSVLHRKMVNEIAFLRDRDNEIEFSDAAACSLPCDDEDALFNRKGDSFDATTFTFQPPEECAVLTTSRGYRGQQQETACECLCKTCFRRCGVVRRK